MQEQELLNAGISAARAGDKERAGKYFAQLVKINPSSEAGWFYLGMCCSATDQREYCLRRVLALNPNNLQARQKLEDMSKPAPQPASIQTPARTAQIPPFETGSPSKPPASASPPVSPFVYGRELKPADENNRPSQQYEQSPLKAEEKKSPDPKPKKSNKTLILSLILIPLLAVFGCVGAYYLLPAQASGLLSPVLPALQVPVLQATQVLPSPVIPPTATPVPPTAIPSPMPTVVYSPVFEETSCPFDKPTNSNINCGTLIVPEDRTGDPSHTIRLSVAVYHSRSDNPDPTPVIFLQGGPGAGAVELAAAAYDYLVYPFLKDRDFIVFDQRGTGLSDPNLACDELKKVYLQDIHGLIEGSTRKLVYSTAFNSCSGLMSVSGVKLNAYTTVESAADIKDLLTVLKLQKVHLYGASYGTRLALVVMREYPEIVSTAILDSVVPVDINFFEQYPDSIETGLNTLFDSCAADPECHAAYPDLKAVFWQLVSDLDANPATVTSSYYPIGTITETVTGSTVMSIILGSIKSTTFINTAPQSIYRFRDADYSTLLAAQYSLPFAFESIAPGLYISMMCHEHILATSREELEAISTEPGVKDYAWLPFYGNADDLFKACQSWGAVGPLLGENDAVFSDIPSLVIAGKFDPTTPPMYAQQVAAQLSRSYYFEFPNQGHTPTAADESGCAMDTVLAFLKNPSEEPDRSCIEDLEEVDFIVPYTGKPPLELETTDVWGVTVKGPSDWYYLGDGFFFRGNSPLDTTLVGVFQDYLTPEELVDWFSVSAYGYRGLDSAPFQVGQRKANGLTWSLYLSSSDGRPVDVALADYGRNSLVVIMFSNLDEHEALYNTVFLPMVDSAR